MAMEVILPKLGQTMEEGTIAEWVKNEGDQIQRGDVLFTIESDKATLEVEAPRKGFLRSILVAEGETVPILTTVALITRTADEEISAHESPGDIAMEGPGLPVTVSAVTSEAQIPATSARRSRTGRIFASPRARKLAREKGVELALVTGTGPGGRIVEKDIRAYLESRPKATPVALKAAESLGVAIATVSGSGPSGRIVKADVEAAAGVSAVPAALPEERPAIERVPLTGLRRIIAERMATSVHTTARVTLVTEVDATALVEAREQLRANVTEEWGFAPGYNDLLAIIVVRALREFPFMNARLSADGQSIERVQAVNVGMAVETERGLLVPVIRDADQKGLRAFGSEFRALVERASAGRALPEDLSGGTFTITNLGMYEIDAFTPVINLPEAAILGVGRIQPKPVAQNGEVVVRTMCTLSLVFDHRLVDGAPAARFLQRIRRLVENLYLLLG